MVHWENFKLMGELMILKLQIEKCEALLITLKFLINGDYWFDWDF